MRSQALYPWSVWLVWVLAVPVGLVVLGAVAVATTDIEDLAFDNPELWWLGAIAPVAGGAFLYGVSCRRRALSRFTSARLAPLLARRISPGRQAVRSGLFVLALLCIAAGLIGPRWGIHLEERKVHGVDIVVALDVSRSMLARDVQPNRLELAKRRIREQLTERDVFFGAHRLALIAFAGLTSLRLPLSTDHLAFQNKLEAVRVGSAPRDGTSIAAAIRKGIDLLERSPEEATKMILVFTDGEDHEGGALEMAQTAWHDHGTHVYTIGVGDPSLTVGAQVPGPDGEKPLVHEGQIVFSRLDMTALGRIAEAGGGRAVAISSLHQLVDAIDRMRTTELTAEERVRHRPRYQWFVAAALLLLVLQTVMGEERTRERDVPYRVWQQETAP